MNLLLRHVTRDLSAYCHGELTPDRERVVESHLGTCARCRTAHDEIRFGVALASRIRTAPAPASLWSGVEGRLEAPARRGGRILRPAVATALALALLGVALVFLRDDPVRVTGNAEPGRDAQLELVNSTAPLTAFETAARDAHRERLAGKLAYEYVTSSPAILRQWVSEHAGFDLSLAIARPPGDAGRFRLLGASVIRAGGARSALVGYEVDARPVTLVSAPLRDVQDPPEELHLRKKVTIRFDTARGLKLLTWGADGQAYVLVSDLPGAGTDACGICHTTPERRALIRDAPVRTGI